MKLSFRQAQSADAAAVADLVNAGYRGDASREGWTTEADYLVGQRTDAAEIAALLRHPDSLIILCTADDEVVGSVHLQRKPDAVYLGMFVVRPALQGRGIGRRFMKAAEEWAQREWRATRMRMHVITLRNELISFYERRGYRRTGLFEPFPIEDKRSIALVDDLQFEVLEKNL